MKKNLSSFGRNQKFLSTFPKKKKCLIKMSLSCFCNDGNVFNNITDCSQCSQKCSSTDYSCLPQREINFIMGVSITTYIILIVLSIALFVFLIYFSIHVMKKCKGKPKWLNPTIITLLVIWILFSWVPGFGFFAFLFLIILLIYFQQKCKNLK